MKSAITISPGPCVSSDFIGEEISCVVDIESSIMLNNNFFKFIAWYDNEWGYSLRVIDWVVHMYNVDHSNGII